MKGSGANHYPRAPALLPLCASLIQMNIYNTIIICIMYVTKRKGQRSPLFLGDHVVSCFTTAEAYIYAHNSKSIVTQYCFGAVSIGE